MSGHVTWKSLNLKMSTEVRMEQIAYVKGYLLALRDVLSDYQPGDTQLDIATRINRDIASAQRTLRVLYDLKKGPTLNMYTYRIQRIEGLHVPDIEASNVELSEMNGTMVATFLDDDELTVGIVIGFDSITVVNEDEVPMLDEAFREHVPNQL